jgi:DNA-binding MarR family transcriptional regulator
VKIRAPGATPIVRRLALFRYRLRCFLRFSEQAARECGLTPQQHQLLLGVAGYTGNGWATVSDLAEFLQERHNAVVGLVERAARKGLVQKKPSAADRRFVRVSLTPRGKQLLHRLAKMHRQELIRLQETLLGVMAAAGRTKRPNLGRGAVRMQGGSAAGPKARGVKSARSGPF